MDFKIIEDDTLVDRVEHVVGLTWPQRLFSWPWRPWVKTRSWFTHVPSAQMVKIGDTIHMHPEAARNLMKTADMQAKRRKMDAELKRRYSAPRGRVVPGAMDPSAVAKTDARLYSEPPYGDPDGGDPIDLAMRRTRPFQVQKTVHVTTDPIFTAQPYQKDMLGRLSQPTPVPPMRVIPDTGFRAVDSMLDAFEPKRSSQAQECDAPKINTYGFPTFDRREPDAPSETGWSCGGGDSSSSDSGSD